MPTIVFVSPKGGAGKTTSALVLATQLAKKAKVEVIDADPNHPIATWATGSNKPENMTVISDANENTITDVIDEAAARSPFVIVDLEGTASKIVVMAVTRADFVIVPTQGSELDAEQAGKALNVIRQHEKNMQRHVKNYKLPFKVLLTRTNAAIRARTLSHIQKSMLAAGIPLFNAEMNEREAFKAMFSFRKPLEDLDRASVSNLDKAIANAEDYAMEVIDELRKIKGD
jgi:chromosome partitioning protein